MNQRGFSLIELLITVAIIGILAAIAIPAYIGQQRRAERTEAFTNLDNLRLIEEQIRADTGNYTAIGVAGSTQAKRDANWSSIRGTLPRWQPGPAGDMKYSYYIILNRRITNATVPFNIANLADTTADVPPTQCFTAIATGADNTRVAGDMFAIDCNNNKNY